MNQKVLIFLTIFSFVFGYSVYEAMKLENLFSDKSSLSTGTVVKELPSVKFYDFQTNKVVNLASYVEQGKNLVIHFWATWCGPCEKEFPDLLELTKLVSENEDVLFVFVAVNDEDKKVKKFLKKLKILPSRNILLLKDNLNELHKFGTFKMPETFVFSKTGTTIKKFSGPQPWTQKYLVDFFLLL